MAVTVESKSYIIGSQNADFELKGLSTDEKPTEINGIAVHQNSLFLELDTGDFYYLKSQGETSTQKTYLLEEMEFQGFEAVDSYSYDLNDNGVFNWGYFLDEDIIKVKFDGEVYTCEKMQLSEYSNWYGSEDFTTIPFKISCIFYPRDGYMTRIFLGDGNTHSLEIYTEETVEVPTVWEKIGGSPTPTPTGNEYDISNPTLHLTINGDARFGYIKNDDGYLKNVEYDGSGEADCVIPYDPQFGGCKLQLETVPSSTSDAVNCQFESRDGYIYIEDESQDASITLTYNVF